jgi:two-component system, sensor histidine kinase
LMQAPLQLQSRPGHGTVFTLQLPKGQLRASSPNPKPAKPQSAALSLQNRLIVIVEDDPSVRAGLEVLLQSWGAQIASFDSVADCQTWLQQAPSASQQCPDLIIADYRLDHGSTGIDVITACRQHFKHPIPAIVVSGSTMAGHEQAALEHHFHWLPKPVAPNKLRAMVGFKLAGLTQNGHN